MTNEKAIEVLQSHKSHWERFHKKYLGNPKYIKKMRG